MAQRTFRQHALGFGSTTATATVTLDGDTIYNGPVETVDQPMPLLPNPEYKVDNVAWSWQADADFSGTKELSITVQGTTLLLAQTVANNPYAANVPPEHEYLPFWRIEVDGVTYTDPLTEEAIDGVVQSGPYRSDERGQWWWRISPGTVFTAGMHVNAAEPVVHPPYIVFVDQPTSVTYGDTTVFQISIPKVSPNHPLPMSYDWRVINDTTTDADFVAVTGNVQFETANSSFSLTTVAQGDPQVSKVFGVEIVSQSGNIIGASTNINLV